MACFKVIGVGEVVMDQFLHINHFPVPDCKLIAREGGLLPGGVTYNTMVAIAKLLKERVGFVCALGDDPMGDALRRDMEEKNVSLLLAITKPKQKTPVNIISITTGKEHEHFILQSELMELTRPTPLEIESRRAFFNGVELLHTTAIHPPATLKTIKIAKEQGATISLDLEPHVADYGEDELMPILKQVDILLPNKGGARTFTGTGDLKAAATIFLNMGIKLVVITRGEEGAVAFSKEGLSISATSATAYPCDVVDTTGAGDTFCAAFTLSNVIWKLPVLQSLKIACAAAALNCQKLGAQEGMPNHNQLIAFLEKNNEAEIAETLISIFSQN